MSIIPVSPTRESAIRRIKQLAGESGKVAISPHARARMMERGLTLIQVLRCLQKGQQDGPVERDEHGSWRARLKHRTAGVQINVIAVLKEGKHGDLVIVVTAFLG